MESPMEPLLADLVFRWHHHALSLASVKNLLRGSSSGKREGGAAQNGDGAGSMRATVAAASRPKGAPVERLAVLREDTIAYFHSGVVASTYHAAAPTKVWTLHRDCLVAPEPFVMELEAPSGWVWPVSLVAGKRKMHRVYCISVAWPDAISTGRSSLSSSQVEHDGSVVLHIGFRTAERAEAWAGRLREKVARLACEHPSAERPSGHVRRRTSSISSSPTEAGGGEERAARWTAIKLVNGVRVYIEGSGAGEGESARSSRERDAQEEPARMISCIIRGDPQSVFTNIWTGFDEQSRLPYFHVVKRIDENRKVVHMQFMYKGNPVVGLLTRTRLALLDATWRLDEDGTYVCLLSNHAQWQRYAKSMDCEPARMNAAITIAPLKHEHRLNPSFSHESLLTIVMRHEPGGYFEADSLPRIFLTADDFFLQQTVDWLVTIRERTEQARFVVKPLGLEDNLTHSQGSFWGDGVPTSRKVKQAVAKVASKAYGMLRTSRRRASQMPPLAEQSAAEGGAAEDEGDGLAAAPSRAGQAWPPSGLDVNYWPAVDENTHGFKVRGKTYLEDRVKILAQDPAFRLHQVDLYELSWPCEHVALHLDYIAENPDKFFYVVQLMVPGPPHYSVIAAFTPKDGASFGTLVGAEGDADGGSPFARLFRTFYRGGDKDRNELFKLIPTIVAGPWIVKKAVGSTPAILGKKIRIAYHRGANYVELDLDIASSAMANNVVRLVSGYTKSVVVEMAFLNEGHCSEELPEALIGILRLNRLDLGRAKRLDTGAALLDPSPGPEAGSERGEEGLGGKRKEE